MNSPSSEARSLTWPVNKFVADVPGVTHAIVVSADGLLHSGFQAVRAS